MSETKEQDINKIVSAKDKNAKRALARYREITRSLIIKGKYFNQLIKEGKLDDPGELVQINKDKIIPLKLIKNN